MRKRTSGFTLVELMITLAILAIIVSIGYPMYTKQVLKSGRVEARTGLTKLAMAQEKYFGLFGVYADTAKKLNFGPDGKKNDVNDLYLYNEAISGLNVDRYSFALAIDSDAKTADFAFTATAGSKQADDDCDFFRIDQTGKKSAQYKGTDDDKRKCW